MVVETDDVTRLLVYDVPEGESMLFCFGMHACMMCNFGHGLIIWFWKLFNVDKNWTSQKGEIHTI